MAHDVSGLLPGLLVAEVQTTLEFSPVTLLLLSFPLLSVVGKRATFEFARPVEEFECFLVGVV